MLKLRVNRQTFDVDVEPDTPLLWVLRDTLGLTGTKFSCGLGECGACTVHLDGDPRRSCLVAVSDVEGREITTIEGLSGHAVQRAWLEEDVPECGYCQSGQMMTAVALLARTPQPTDSDIDKSMYDVLCRCGTYQRIRKAIHRAAEGGGK